MISPLVMIEVAYRL